MRCVIGIRPIVDGRSTVRNSLEAKAFDMANAAKNLIENNCFYSDGTKAQCIIAPTTIGGAAEAAEVRDYFVKENVTATLSVTPCWCYGTETIDNDPKTIKAVWGFNGTERPGAVYLAAAMAAHAQLGLPAFAIYGREVQDMNDNSIPDDVAEKILRFAKCALAAGQMQGKSYVNIGTVSMGIMGSYCDIKFFQNYLGIRSEFVDTSEIIRRIEKNIFDPEEFARALAWAKKNCAEGRDVNRLQNIKTKEQKDKDWEFVVKMTLILRDIMLGNQKLKELGFSEESMGRNAIAGGFQGQRQWTDFLPNGDFSESIINSSFDWNGRREPQILATENDGLNAVSMLIGKLLTGTAAVFADVRTYWDKESVKRVTGKYPEGIAKDGFLHLINSGAAALDGCGKSGKGKMKQWWKMTQDDIDGCLKATDWCPANRDYFRGGGYSSRFSTDAEMPVTMIRVNIVDGIGPVIQFAEGYTVNLPKDISNALWERTDPAWPSTWFVPRLNGKDAFTDVYSVMANWGANHGAFVYGHIGNDILTLASILRIPVNMHNASGIPFRPAVWSAFGTKNTECADFAACAHFGALYK